MFFSLATGLLPKNSFSEAPQLQTSSPLLVSVKPVPPDKPVRPGESFTLTMELTVSPGYHINSQKPEDELLIPTSVEFRELPVVEVKEVSFPPALKKKFKFSEKMLSVYEGQIKIKVRLKMADDFCGSSLELEGKVRYQACNDAACLRPMTVPFKVNIAVAS
ncbi:MAG: protein-disulfide reductase DsbD N-terminal domain-containing protein [Candidatus Aminicenantes bacterium]|nr:protein-disulfide reductase DsbD N-terminal domain-containing protein [Candidatus Aminicenantes bacterium]